MGRLVTRTKEKSIWKPPDDINVQCSSVVEVVIISSADFSGYVILQGSKVSIRFFKTSSVAAGSRMNQNLCAVLGRP